MADENDFEVEMVNHEDDFTLINNSPQICSSQSVDFAIEDAISNKETSMEMDFYKAIVDKNALEVKMFNPEDNSAISPQNFGSQHLDFAIEEATNNKKTLVSAMDSVIDLMRQVECEEKAAEEAKEEAAKSSSQILAMVDQLRQAHQLAKETNAMHAREVYAQKAVLATELEELQLRVSCLLDDEDISFVVLDEMRKALETRLASALIKKELADKEKLEKEESFREALAYHESQIGEVVEESNRLKQEAVENSMLQEFLIDRGHEVDMLRGEISDKCCVLRKELDFVIPQIGSSSSLTTSSSGFLLVDSALLSKNSSSNLENRDQHGSECKNSMNGIKRRIKVSKEKMILNMFRIMKLKKKAKKKKLIEELIMDAVTGFCQDDFVTDYGRGDFDDGKDVTVNSFFILILVILNLAFAFWK